MMSLHKLTAGDGYMYLIRQVAAADDTARGRGALGDYYSSKGETPGRWMEAGWPHSAMVVAWPRRQGSPFGAMPCWPRIPREPTPGPLRRDRKSPKRR